MVRKGPGGFTGVPTFRQPTDDTCRFLQAHLAPVTSMGEVEEVMTVLLDNTKVPHLCIVI